MEYRGAHIKRVVRNTGVVLRRLFRNTDWVLGLGSVLFILLLAMLGNLAWLEDQAYKLGMRLSSDRTASSEIVVVAIDDATLEELGSWPLSRRTIANAVRIIGRAQPRGIGLTFPLSDSWNASELAVVERLRKSYEKELGEAGATVFSHIHKALDTDASLAASMRGAGVAVLSMPFTSVGDSGTSSAVLPANLAPFALGREDDGVDDGGWFLGRFLKQPPEAARLSTPLRMFVAAAEAVGVSAIDERADPVEPLQRVPFAVRYSDGYLPAFPLVMAAYAFGYDADALSLESRTGIRIGEHLLRTDTGLQALPFFYRGRDGASPFKTVSLADVLKGAIEPGEFAGKSVLVGLTAAGSVQRYRTPTGQSLPPVMVSASVLSSILSGDLIQRPVWVPAVQIAVYLIISLYLAFLLPRLTLVTGFLSSTILAFVLLNVQLFVLMTESLWLPLMAPMAALILGHLLLAGKRMLQDRVHTYKTELLQSNFLLAQAFQAQGQFDRAFERYKKCGSGDEVTDHLYHLGLDYERKRQFGRAAEVFHYIERLRAGYKDICERIKRNQQRLNSFVVGGGSANTGGSLLVANDGIQKPMLGRYRIDKELGKGEMGVVYLGHDPKIGRKVAIKTMALSEEFDEDVLPDVRHRFMREAATAGRLNHPNIVTIYDVGEDQGLAYIAMDFLEGSPISSFSKRANLLPVQDVLKIGIQVAAALDTAHRDNVVHRDIKPANILYDPGTGVATVTDFGVACITDASKTKSGIILGTPAFMSPEQLAGRKVDGRSDIFSLGVTLYQLLTGRLPFEGDTISTLMYKIANEQQVDIRKLRSGLPECASLIINKALEKDAEQRFQRAGLLASALRRCLQGVSAGVDVTTRKPRVREVVLG